jgi:hypothetical protein
MTNEWQPIDTAPMQEYVILWSPAEPEGKVLVGYLSGRNQWYDESNGLHIDPAPSHWMPLPEAPK